MNREELVTEICKAVDASDKNVYDICIRFNGEVRIGYKADRMGAVNYQWFREWQS